MTVCVCVCTCVCVCVSVCVFCSNVGSVMKVPPGLAGRRGNRLLRHQTITPSLLCHRGPTSKGVEIPAQAFNVAAAWLASRFDGSVAMATGKGIVGGRGVTPAMVAEVVRTLLVFHRGGEPFPRSCHDVASIWEITLGEQLGQIPAESAGELNHPAPCETD